MAYLPTIRKVTIDMTRLAARPRRPGSTNQATSVIGTFANSGTQDFTPPGNNHDGDGDWVLMLQAAAARR